MLELKTPYFRGSSISLSSSGLVLSAFLLPPYQAIRFPVRVLLDSANERL